MLAWIRYETLRSRGNLSGRQIDLNYSYISIASVVSMVSILNTPNFLTYKINEMQLKDACIIVDTNITDPQSPAYVPGVSDLALQSGCLVFRMAFWISGSLFKLFPCICLTLLVWLLVRILSEVKRNRVRLLKPTTIVTTENGNAVTTHIPSSSRRAAESTDRTTRMLLSIVSVFLLTELPQGIMAVLSGLFSEEFRMYIYNGVGDILDLLSLINSCTTFVIYCTMSAQFRQEFRRVFLPRSIADRFGGIIDDRRRLSEPFSKMSFMRTANDHHHHHHHDNDNDNNHLGGSTSVISGGGDDSSCESIRKHQPPNAVSSSFLLSPNYSTNLNNSINGGIVHWSSSSRETLDESTELLPNGHHTSSSEHFDDTSAASVIRSTDVSQRRRLIIDAGDVETRYHRV